MSVCKVPDPRHYRRVAVGILRDETSFNWCAIKSYLHSNGFVKILLQKDASGESVRLHYWPRPSIDDDIHNHRWSFSSVVLSGEFVESLHVVELDANGDGLRYRYSRRGLDGMLTHPRAASIRQIDSHLLTANSNVERAADQFHKFTCTDTDGGMTLVRTVNPSKRYSLVVRESQVPVDPHVPTEAIQQAELRAILEKFVDSVTSSA